MKRYTKFAQNLSVLFFVLLSFGWIYYALYQYAYLQHSVFTDSLFAFTRLLLSILPILVLLLLLTLLAIRKPRHKKLHTEISLFLLLLFSVNLFLSIYTSRDYFKSGHYKIISHYKDEGDGYILITDGDHQNRLHCPTRYYEMILPFTEYDITYRGNDFFPRSTPTVIELVPASSSHE